MAVIVWQVPRPKRRTPVWVCRVTDGERVVFDSAWVSVRCRSSADARWLGELVQALQVHERFPYPPGHRQAGPDQNLWEGPVPDDWSVDRGAMYAHAEHLEGPRRGGSWYCMVNRGGASLFHTADHGIRPRDGEAARWLCELVMAATDAGVLGADGLAAGGQVDDSEHHLP